MTWRGTISKPGDVRMKNACGRDRDTAHIPLFAESDRAQVLVWRGATPIARTALLHDAAAFASAIPATAEIVNCCEDRYNFLVVFVACLLRGKAAILPHDARQSALLAIAEQFSGSLFAADRPMDAPHSLLRRVSFAGTRPSRMAPNPEIPGDQEAVILFTSGTTARAVPIVRSWAWLVAGATDYVSGLSLQRLDGLAIISTVPPQHSYGLEATVMLPLRSNASTYATRPLFPQDVFGALTAARAPAALVTTPFHLEALLRSRERCPKIALVLSATSPLSKALAARAEAAFGAEVREVYGCSEVGLVGTRRPTHSEFWEPGASLTLNQADGRTYVTARHLPNRIELPDVISPEPDGAFRLGERNTDMVKIAGHRASLAGLNLVLRSLPGVVDGVIVSPPGKAAARLAGFVVLDGRSLGDVKRDLRASLAGPFMPRPLLEVPAVPRGATGKVMLEPLLGLLAGRAPRA